MKTTVIVYARGLGYVADVNSAITNINGKRIGTTPDGAAAQAARLMIAHAQRNPWGGELVAPDEVMERVPRHLRNIAEGAAA